MLMIWVARGGNRRNRSLSSFSLPPSLPPSLPDCAQRLPQDLGRCARPTKPHATMGVSASHRALAARRSPWDEPIERVKRPPEAVKLLNTLPPFPISSLPGQKFFLSGLLQKTMFRRSKLSIWWGRWPEVVGGGRRWLAGGTEFYLRFRRRRPSIWGKVWEKDLFFIIFLLFISTKKSCVLCVLLGGFGRAVTYLSLILILS